MRTRHIDTDGAQALVHAIVRSASADVLRHKPGAPARRSAEAFFCSAWFETLTGFNGRPTLRKLQAIYARRHPKKQKGGKA